MPVESWMAAHEKIKIKPPPPPYEDPNAWAYEDPNAWAQLKAEECNARAASGTEEAQQRPTQPAQRGRHQPPTARPTARPLSTSPPAPPWKPGPMPTDSVSDTGREYKCYGCDYKVNPCKTFGDWCCQKCNKEHTANSRNNGWHGKRCKEQLAGALPTRVSGTQAPTPAIPGPYLPSQQIAEGQTKTHLLIDALSTYPSEGTINHQINKKPNNMADQG